MEPLPIEEDEGVLNDFSALVLPENTGAHSVIEYLLKASKSFEFPIGFDRSHFFGNTLANLFWQAVFESDRDRLSYRSIEMPYFSWSIPGSLFVHSARILHPCWAVSYLAIDRGLAILGGLEAHPP